MARIRYDIQVRASQNGRRLQVFNMNRDPLRPGGLDEKFREAVQQQWDHLSFSDKYGDKCRGLDFRSAKDDVGFQTGSVWMWGLGSAIVVKVVRHGDV